MLKQTRFMKECQDKNKSKEIVKEFKKELSQNNCITTYAKRPKKQYIKNGRKMQRANTCIVFSARYMKVKINDDVYECKSILFDNSKKFARYLYLDIISNHKLIKMKLSTIKHAEILSVKPYEKW